MNVMLHSLRRERLAVGLAEAPEARHCGHLVRVVNGQNPEWYRELCEQYPSYRKHQREKHSQTRISRKRIIKALECLVKGKGSKSWYVRDLISAAEDVREDDEEDREAYEEKYGKATGKSATA